MKTITLVLAVATLLAGCENENLNVQLSKATSEADKHTGVNRRKTPNAELSGPPR